jgi:hypothetical protein
MIVAIGIAADPTFAHFVKFARANRAALTVIDLRRLQEGSWRLSLPPREGDWLRLGRTRLMLDPKASYYVRIIDLAGTEDADRASDWARMVSALTLWLRGIDGLVVNHPDATSHNSAKHLHEVILRNLGFDVPPAVTTADRAVLRAFVAGGDCVLKASSGVRGDAQPLGPDGVDAVDLSYGPVHVQRRVVGDDVRVHVVGETAIACRIRSPVLDYRTANAGAVYAPWELPAALSDHLVKASAELGLALAGWDFKVRDGAYHCLEANPMPGYRLYDRHLGHGISKALLKLLSGAGR